MRMRNLLLGFALAMMVLFAGNVGSISAGPAPSCATECFNNFLACRDSCGGDPVCLAQCHEDKECCTIQCHGGSCGPK